jgi:hypothetical protein
LSCLAAINGTADFMIAIHAGAVARLTFDHIDCAESGQSCASERAAALTTRIGGCTVLT